MIFWGFLWAETAGGFGRGRLYLLMRCCGSTARAVPRKFRWTMRLWVQQVATACNPRLGSTIYWVSSLFNNYLFDKWSAAPGLFLWFEGQNALQIYLRVAPFSAAVLIELKLTFIRKRLILWLTLNPIESAHSNCLEYLVHVGVFCCWGFIVGKTTKLLAKRPCLFVGYCSIVHIVELVPHQNDILLSSLGALLSKKLNLLLQRQKCVPPGQVKHDNCALTPAEVLSCQGTEVFLTGGVPNLQSHSHFVKFKGDRL